MVQSLEERSLLATPSLSGPRAPQPTGALENPFCITARNFCSHPKHQACCGPIKAVFETSVGVRFYVKWLNGPAGWWKVLESFTYNWSHRFEPDPYQRCLKRAAAGRLLVPCLTELVVLLELLEYKYTSCLGYFAQRGQDSDRNEFWTSFLCGLFVPLTQPAVAAGRLFKQIQGLSWIVIHPPQLRSNWKYPPCYLFIQSCKPSPTASQTGAYRWHWCLQENMLEESIPPTPRNRILLMLKLKIIPQEVIKKTNPKPKNPTPSICNLPFPPSPKAMTNSASQVSHNSSTLSFVGEWVY